MLGRPHDSWQSAQLCASTWSVGGTEVRRYEHNGSYEHDLGYEHNGNDQRTRVGLTFRSAVEEAGYPYVAQARVR